MKHKRKTQLINLTFIAMLVIGMGGILYTCIGVQLKDISSAVVSNLVGSLLAIGSSRGLIGSILICLVVGSDVVLHTIFEFGGAIWGYCLNFESCHPDYSVSSYQ